MATIQGLQRKSASRSRSPPLSSDATLPTLVTKDWQRDHDAGVLDQILRSIFKIPCPALIRLTAHLIDYLDLSDADPESEEDDPDCEHDGREPDYHR
jgi:hypothetical protein